MTKHASFIRVRSIYIVLVLHRAYNTCSSFLVLCYGHRLQYNNSSKSMQPYMHDIVHRSFYLQHFRHYYCCNNCCCSHMNSTLQCVATGQASITPYSSSSVQYARNTVRLFLDETHARGAQIRCITRTFTFGFSERGALVPQTVGRSVVLIL